MTAARRKGKTRRQSVSSEQFLAAKVHRNEAMEMTERPGGGCLVKVPMRRPRWFIPPFSWLLPYSAHRRVELDRLGTEVLRACDGRHTVEEMIENFAASHKLSFREAQLSVTTFLKQLTQRGLVAVVGP